jgi:hypothetical protein
MRPRTTFPSFDKLIEAAGEFATLTEGPIAIGGGLAMQFWGSPRLTADVDLVAHELPTGAPPGAALSFGGLRTRAANGVPVDVIVRADDWADLYDEALDHAVDVDGAPAPVVTPEYLVAMKMVAGRPKDEEDVRYLVLTEDFNMAACEVVVEEHLGKYATKELRAAVEEAKWRESREET